MSSAYSPYAAVSVAVASVPSSAASNRFFSFHSQIQFHHRFPPKPFKLLRQNPNLLLFLPKLRRHHFSAAISSGNGWDGEEISASEEPIEEEEEEMEDEDEGKSPETQASGEEGRLYVGNLPYAMTSSELALVFGEAGNVVDVQIVYDKVTDRSRGFGFVTMGTSEEANEAIQMFDGSQIGGRTVKVNFPEVPMGGEREVMRVRIRDNNRDYVDSPHKIYAGNLGWGLTSQGLKNAFANQPGLLGAKVIYDRNSGRSRGFGFISFESTDAVQSALDAMNGVEVEGRPLRLSFAVEKAPGFRPNVAVNENEESLESNELFSGANT
ncbi:PREDICTED: RNA-binding protein CP33, chloroplastic [Tarenaya hassleriana]|uniref:RNA-binding protein CP33, chloroplastic n=1 Tax=Tarenaya hassleriana TaxID=28532 RepID=UPI00053C3BF5|nr:PREDICTED: RNA-binding protein CP33, chloroplastic [Tarenaya hassleriana]